MDKLNLGKLTTESRNQNTLDIDKVSTIEMVRIINEEDKKVALAVEKEIPQIAKAIDGIVERAKKIVSEATGLNIEEATKVLNETNFDVKLAIFMTLSKLDKEEAKSKLDESKGYIAKALELVNA